MIADGIIRVITGRHTSRFGAKLTDMNSPTAAVMLATVRVARGFTQARLAKATGIPQATLSMVESGLIDLDDDRLAALAAGLDVPTDLLLLPSDFAGAPSIVFHRKRASLPVSAATRLRARLDLIHLQVGALVGDDIPVRLQRQPLGDQHLVTPEEVAREVRADLRMPAGPVRNLIGSLESAGVVVVREDLGSIKVDALMSWRPGGRPIVLLGDHAPGDRQRFSIGHETGHAVMHQVPTEDQESQADRFASELLLPAADLRGSLGDVSLPKLARLKEQWGVSMAAILRRAHSLNEISDFQYRRANIELSQSGYRVREPVEVAREKPTLLVAKINEQLAQGASVADLARRTWMTEHDFRSTYLQEAAQ